MTDIAKLGIEIDATQVEKGTRALEGLEQAGAKTERSVNKMASQYTFLNDNIKTTNASTFEASKEVQRLMDRYDPLGTKLRSLESDFKSLDKAMAGGQIGGNYDVAVEKTYAGLNAEIAKTKDLMEQAGAGMEGVVGHAERLGGMTAYSRRELMQLGKEALEGNFSRMPQTFTSLIVHSGLAGTAIGVLGTAVIAGALGWELYGANVKKLRDEIEQTNKSIGIMNIEELNKHYSELQKKMEDVQAKAASGGFGWNRAREEAVVYREELQKLGKFIDEHKQQQELFKDPNGEMSKLASTSELARKDKLSEDIKRLQEYSDASKTSEQDRMYAISKITELKKNLSDLDKKDLTEFNRSAKDRADAAAAIQILDTETAGHIQLTESQKKLIQLDKERLEGVSLLTSAQYAQQQAELIGKARAEVDHVAAIKAEKDATEETRKHTQAQNEWNAMLGKSDHAEAAIQSWGKLLELQKELNLTDLQIIEVQKKVASESTKAAEKTNAAWKTFADNTQRTLSDVMFAGLTGKMVSVEQMFRDMLMRMVANALAMNLTKAMFGEAGGGTAGSTGWMGALVGAVSSPTPRAMGGAVSGNTPYLVGEKRPELFVPSTSGTIIPDLAGIGSKSITINDNTVINIDSRADRAQVMNDVGKLIDNKQASLLDKMSRQGLIA